MKKFSLLLLLSCLSLIVAPRISFGAYCTPSFYGASASCYSYGVDVAQLRIAGESGSLLNDVSACTGSGYEDQTSTGMTVSLMQSLSYTATIRCSGSYSCDAQVWIDFNNNTTFEASESVGGLNSYTSSTFNITIPVTAATGSHRMRIVVTGSGSYYPSVNPCGGYYLGDARDYNITIVALPACSGTPTGGTATTTAPVVCPSESFTLSTTGSTAASGVTYQWQRSSDSSTWTNISGATNFTLTTTESATYFYRRSITCTSSSSTSYSSGVRVTYISVCYCTPTYTSASYSCSSYFIDISRFNVVGESGSSINDVMGCSGTGYLNRTVLYDTFKQGITYHPTIYSSGSYALNCQTFIDFNDNGTFETSESVGGLNAYTYSGTYNITMPITAPLGMHRMRVVMCHPSGGASYPSISSCPSPYSYGEARDYTIYIVALPACSGTMVGGRALSSVRLACPGTPFTLTDTGFTAASSLTFQWQSSSDSSTWTNISGATTVTYSYTASAPLYYRLLVTCSASGSTAPSAGVFVNYLGICFCIPTFSYGPASCTTYHFAFSRVQFAGESGTSINDALACTSSTTDSGYQDRTSLSVTFMQSVSYTATITPSTAGSGGNYLSNQVWIDFNDNGTFESSESVGGNASYPDSGPITETITIPFAGFTGNHRMRIVQVYTGYGYAYPTLSPCTAYASSSSGHYYYGEARDYMVTIVPLPPCSGTPTAGTVTTTSATACPSLVFTLGLSGSTVAGSLTWQWQRSSDSSTWTSISGATNVTYATTETASYYYRCIITCTVSGSSVNTPGLLIPYVGYCYCTPTWGDAPRSCSVYNFALSGLRCAGESGTLINDTNPCDGTGYRNFTTMSASLMQSVSYLVTVTPASTGSSASTAYGLSNQIWIDFNDNGTFETSERVGGKAYYPGTSPTIDTITMPLTASVGNHRMRIVQVYTSGGTYTYPTLNPCPTPSIYTYGEARDYTINIVPLPPCSGTPTAGTASSSSATACPSYVFTLSLSGYTVAGSLTFQWQSSPDSATWTNMSGATNTSYSLTETATRYYRCVVVCTVSGSSDTSTVVLVPYVGYCYCVPVFSSASSGCTTYRFQLDGMHVYGEAGTSILDNARCDGSGYRNMTSLSATMMNSLTYLATVYPSTGGTSSFVYTLNNQMWIDFNDNGTFESSETVAGANGYGDNTPVIDTIRIPTSAPTGTHRMRLVQGYSAYAPTYPSINPCPTSYFYGEARDYTINVVPLPPCNTGLTNAGNAVASVGTACPGIPFTLTDVGYSMASGLTFQWQVSNDSSSWTNISGATTVSWTLTQTGPKYYRCIITCSTTGSSLISVPVYVSYISYCYCTPSYTMGTASCATYHMGISRNYIPGAAGTILNDTTACNSTCYENLTSMSVSFFQGTVYQDSITTAYTAGTMCAQVWIDYNNDGTFATSESVGGANYYTGHIRFNLTIPASAALGCHRMRVVTAYGGSGYSYSGMDPCTYGYSLGDARDYTACIVLPGCTGTPTAGTIVATDTTGCSGYTSSMSLSGASVGTGILYQWQSSPTGSSWTNITGATNTSYSVTVTTPMFYRAIITCGTTTLSATSGSIHLNVAAPPSSPTGAYYTCSGSSITWSATPTGGTWSSASTSIATVTPSTGVIYGIATGTSVITYTLPTGCYSTRTVIVNPSPAAITGASSVCVGSSTTLADATTGGTWSSSSTGVATISSTGVVTGVSSGTVTISYTLSTGCSGGSPTTTRTFTVNPLPSAITGVTALCMGYPSTLSSTPTGGTWSSSSVTVATISPSTGSVTGMSSGSATITYTSPAGCRTSTGVTVNPVVVPTLSISYTPTTAVCAGATVTLNATSTNGGSTPTYVWSVNGVISAGGTTYAYAPANGDVVRCWFHSSATCAVPDTLASSVTMSVNPVVTPAVTASTGMGDTVCLGTVTTLTASSTGSGTGPTYHWYVNGVGTGSTASTYSYIPSNGDVVTVRVISTMPCRTADSGTYSKVLTVSPYVTPGVSLTSSAGSTVCSGTAVTYTGTGSFGGTAPTYQWMVNTSSVGSGSTYSYTPSNGDTVKVIYTSNFPCVTTPTATNNMVMTVIPVVSPVGMVTVTPGTTVAPGVAATFTCTITSGGGSAPTYQWTINGAPQSGATNATFTTSALFTGAVVSCIVTNTDPCSSVSTFSGVTMTVSSTATGLNNVNNAEGNVTVLPNPNSGTFAIKGNIGMTINETVAVEITNMLGQVIYTANVTASKGEINHPVTLSNKLANGMYILNVKSEHLNKVFHFVLEQ